VDVERAGLRLVFAVARLRGGALDVRPPRGPDGTGAGIWLPARERERVAALVLAAVDGDREARSVLRPYGCWQIFSTNTRTRARPRVRSFATP
jgi:hypothetical protein